MKNYRKEWEEKKPVCPEYGGDGNYWKGRYLHYCELCDETGIQPYIQYLEAELENRDSQIEEIRYILKKYKAIKAQGRPPEE